jgi:hypothetical protein
MKKNATELLEDVEVLAMLRKKAFDRKFEQVFGLN